MIVLVGEAPSKGKSNADPLSGRSGTILASLMGLTLPEYLRRTRRMNVLSRWPGSAAKGSKFPIRKARKSARAMWGIVEGASPIFLGKRVALAFGSTCAYLRWADEPFRHAVFPHPSGINRWWNDPKNMRKASRFMRSAMRELRA